MVNILLISYFKYLGFFTDIVNALLGYDIHLSAVVLPLAISFFTFQQIAWLVDSYSGIVHEQPDFFEYALFVMFFPQLIAGPIVHYGEIIPQFRATSSRRFQIENFTAGLSIFIIGLFKKVVVADNIAPVANLIFVGTAWGQSYNML
ncbi:MAG: MBOAT family protein, partial [Gammaproteobacteria bacterium]